MKNKIQLDAGQSLVAQWETSGKDWIVLYKQTVARLGDRVGPFVVYGYSQGAGNRWSGGGDPDYEMVDGMAQTCTDLDDEGAITAMERPWNAGGKPGAGAAFILKCDRPSLCRVF